MFCSSFGWNFGTVMFKSFMGDHKTDSVQVGILNNLGSMMCCSSFGWNFSGECCLKASWGSQNRYSTSGDTDKFEVSTVLFSFFFLMDNIFGGDCF